MWFGAKLAIEGTSDTRGRFIATVIGIALSSGLLLLVLAGVHGLNRRDERQAWLSTSDHSAESRRNEDQVDPLLWNRDIDQYQELPIDVVTLAATGPTSPIPPGIPANPGAGEYYASPALARLIANTPKAELGDRFAGGQIGLISPAALASPDSLVVIQGTEPARLGESPFTDNVIAINTHPQPSDGTIKIVLGIGAIGIFFPIMVFIVASTRLGAAVREQRYAALRLIGATPGQVNRFAAIESSMAAGVGTLLGFVLFFVSRPLATRFSLGGGSFFVSELSVDLLTVGAVFVAIPLVAAVGTVVSLRRLNISPLGVSRQERGRPPSPWRLGPLVSGIVLFGSVVLTTRLGVLLPGDMATIAFFASFTLIPFGIVVAGSWLTKIGSLALARFTSSGAALIALRRIESNPAATFRAVSGLVLALFMVSLYSGTAHSYLLNRGNDRPGVFQSDMVEFSLVAPPLTSRARANAVVRALQGDEGVRQVIPVYPIASEDDEQGLSVEGIVACAGVEQLEIGACEGGTEGYAAIPVQELLWSALTPRTWPRMAIDASALDRAPFERLLIRTDGSPRTIERVRTLVKHHAPWDATPVTQASLNVAESLIAELQQLAYAGIVVSVIISAASLAVAVIGGIMERRRSFSLLRLAGTPMSSLRRVIVLEAVVPLLAVSILSAGLGFLVAGLLLSGLDGTVLQPPAASYYLTVGVSILAALGIVATTLPLMRRLTDFDQNRFE